MTTIAYRDGILAADTLATWHGIRESTTTKIRDINGVFVAASGSFALCIAFLDWVQGGLKGDSPFSGTDEGNGLVCAPSGPLVVWGKYGPWTVRSPFYALGSGENIALGAMAMGATAEEAVAAAIRLDTNTGGEITVLRRS